MNTNGGGLSYTHTGMYGMFAIQEAVRQLRGDGPAQVDGARTSVAQGVGRNVHLGGNPGAFKPGPLRRATMDSPKYLGDFALLTPDKPAVINGTTGASLSYRELDERSTRLAQYLYSLGLRKGDHFAMVLENNMRCFELAWAAFRSGLLLTAVNRFVTAEEAAYIVADSDAKVVVSSYAMRELAAELTERMPTCERRLMLDGTIEGGAAIEEALAGASPERLADEWMGATMLYSSGTTGRPKGVLSGAHRAPSGIDGMRRRSRTLMHAAMEHRQGHRVPLHRTAVPRGAAGLCDGGAVPRRHGDHGAVRAVRGARR